MENKFSINLSKKKKYFQKHKFTLRKCQSRNKNDNRQHEKRMNNEGGCNQFPYPFVKTHLKILKYTYWIVLTDYEHLIGNYIYSPHNNLRYCSYKILVQLYSLVLE